MKLDTKFDALMLTMGELSVLARQPGSAENVLSLVPKIEADGKESILAAFGRLDKDKRDDYSKAIAMLAAPSQVARLHYSVADETVTRIYLAWRPENKDSVAALALTDGKLAVSLQPADRIERMLSGALALTVGLQSANLTKSLSANATIVLIAVMDYFRYGRYRSLLTHTDPPGSFSQSEVMERIEDASSEDFRWPLLMLDKVFPVPIAGRFQAEDVTAALEELCRLDLLTKNEAEGGKPELTLYSLTPAANTVCDSLLHDVSKAALGISSAGADGIVGHEAMLLVRSSNYLWLLGIGGTEGVVASIDGKQFSEMLKQALTPPEKMPPVITNASRATQAAPGVAPGIGTSACPKCGARNPVGTKFCAGCGATMAAPGPKFCPKCGDPVKAGEKFCDKCGTKLA
ncbi:MAG: zinc-ribbon domain-containing protein [Dehalococcoidales bacterium]|nr:zinc-ribbon domain-containing protein [Dehalococcoidales bacterium]